MNRKLKIFLNNKKIIVIVILFLFFVKKEKEKRISYLRHASRDEWKTTFKAIASVDISICGIVLNGTILTTMGNIHLCIRSLQILLE